MSFIDFVKADRLWKTEAGFFKHVDYDVVLNNFGVNKRRACSTSINLPVGAVHVLPWLDEAMPEIPESVLRIAAGFYFQKLIKF